MHKLLVRVLKTESDKRERERNGRGPIRMFTEGTHQILGLLTN